MFYQLYNIKLSHVTIADWCKKFAPIFNNISLKLMPMMDFNSDGWHADETVVKINGKKHHLWFIIDSETRFCSWLSLISLPFLSSGSFSIQPCCTHMGNPSAIISDHYSAYKLPAKCYFSTAKHIRVESFKNNISSKLI